MQITLILSSELSAAWHEASLAPPADALRRALDALGAGLRPLHPGATDPELGRHFVVDVSEPGTARAARARLAKVPGVDAAYIKPEDALP